MTVNDYHDCKLQYDVEESIVKQIIDTGIFINTRRKLCELAIINKSHPKTQLYYKSSAACRKEELRQVVNYPYMSHPFCIWCLYWEFFIFWVYLYLYVCITVGSFFVFTNTSYHMNWARIGADSILTLDIIHLFFKGYYDTEKSRTIMQQSEVAKLSRNHSVKMVVLFIGVLGGMMNTLLSNLKIIPACHDAAEILAGRMQKAVILGSLQLLRAHMILGPNNHLPHRCGEWLFGKYLMTYFFIDLMATIPSCIFIACFIGGYIMPPEYTMCIRLIAVLRILRIGRWLDTLELFRQYMNHSSYLFKGIKAVLVYIIMMCSFIAIMTTLIYMIEIFQFHRMSVNNSYIRLFSAILILLVVSHGDSLPDDAGTVIVVSLFLCIGYIMHLFLCAQVLQVWNKFSRARDTNENLLRQFKVYMKYKGLSATLRERIYTYFQFKFHNEFYSEAQINSMISDLLKKEILKHVTKKHMDRSKLFSSLPEPVMLSMISYLKSVIYLTDDVIVTAGKRGYHMYFIYYGTVAVYTEMGKEVCHLEDGDHFGEMALIFNESASATIVAVTPCELFKLSRTDFFAVLDLYPDLKTKIISDARLRLLKHRSDMIYN